MSERVGNTNQIIDLYIVLWITFFVAERIYSKFLSVSISSMNLTKIQSSEAKTGDFTLH